MGTGRNRSTRSAPIGKGGTGLTAITIETARALLFPELTAPIEGDEFRPRCLLPTWINPAAHALDEAVGNLLGPPGWPSNRAPKGRPAPRLRDRRHLETLRVECPWYQARVDVLYAVRFAARDADRARIVVEEVEPRMRRREAEAERLALRLREFIGGEFMADAMEEGPRYGATFDLLALVARCAELGSVAGDLLKASQRLQDFAKMSAKQRAKIAPPRVDPEIVWKRTFAAHLCASWVLLTGSRPSSGESSRFIAFVSAAITSLGGDMDQDLPMQTQVREAIECEADRPDQDRFDLREKLLNPGYVATEKAPASSANPDGDASTFDLMRRIMLQGEDPDSKIH